MVLPKNIETNSAVFPLSLAAGVLLALCIGVGVRLNKEHPPSDYFQHYTHLLDKPAPSFEVEGLNGGRVSLPKNPTRSSRQEAAGILSLNFTIYGFFAGVHVRAGS